MVMSLQKGLRTTFLIHPENKPPEEMKDVLACMFWRKPALADPALALLELIDKRKELADSYWSEFCEIADITRGQYDSIIRKLKAGGFIYKRNNFWRISVGFDEFLVDIIKITKDWRDKNEE
ncbi:MAG: hypothetical protein U9N35_03695 [Euryarchaeota archaeon]|nr:hypothetical protein [Euryarchaeota archaeon]